MFFFLSECVDILFVFICMGKTKYSSSVHLSYKRMPLVYRNTIIDIHWFRNDQFHLLSGGEAKRTEVLVTLLLRGLCFPTLDILILFDQSLLHICYCVNIYVDCWCLWSIFSLSSNCISAVLLSCCWLLIVADGNRAGSPPLAWWMYSYEECFVQHNEKSSLLLRLFCASDLIIFNSVLTFFHSTDLCFCFKDKILRTTCFDDERENICKDFLKPF